MTYRDPDHPDQDTPGENPDDHRIWLLDDRHDRVHEYAHPSVIFHGHRVPLSFYGITPGPTGIDSTGFAPGGLI